MQGFHFDVPKESGRKVILLQATVAGGEGRPSRETKRGATDGHLQVQHALAHGSCLQESKKEENRREEEGRGEGNRVGKSRHWEVYIHTHIFVHARPEK